MSQTRASKGEMLMRNQIKEIHADVAFLRKAREDWLQTWRNPPVMAEPQPPPPKTVVEEPRKMTGCPVCDGEAMPMDMNKLVLCRSHASQMFPGMRVKIATPVTVEDNGPGVEEVDPTVADEPDDAHPSLVDQVLASSGGV